MLKSDYFRIEIKNAVEEALDRLRAKIRLF